MRYHEYAKHSPHIVGAVPQDWQALDLPSADFGGSPCWLIRGTYPPAREDIGAVVLIATDDVYRVAGSTGEGWAVYAVNFSREHGEMVLAVIAEGSLSACLMVCRAIRVADACPPQRLRLLDIARMVATASTVPAFGEWSNYDHDMACAQAHPAHAALAVDIADAYRHHMAERAARH